MKARARTTLGDLHRATPWLWLHCEKCQHYAPLACAVPVIRWGAETSSDKLRQCARCTACGHKGATIQHPGWAGERLYAVSDHALAAHSFRFHLDGLWTAWDRATSRYRPLPLGT